MPVVGVSFGDKIEIGTFKTPKNYISGSRRKFRPGPEHQKSNY
jgi:hypothetical protein